MVHERYVFLCPIDQYKINQSIYKHLLQVVSSTNGDVNPDERPGREGSKEPITAQQEVEVVDETK